MEISENSEKLFKSFGERHIHEKFRIAKNHIDELGISEKDTLYSLKELKNLGLIEYNNQSGSPKKFGIVFVELTNEGRDLLQGTK